MSLTTLPKQERKAVIEDVHGRLAKAKTFIIKVICKPNSNILEYVVNGKQAWVLGIGAHGGPVLTSNGKVLFSGYANVADGEWHTIGFVIEDPSFATIYVDGSQVPVRGTADFSLINSGKNRLIVGESIMCDLTIWESQLPPVLVSVLSNPNERPDPRFLINDRGQSLMAWFPMDTSMKDERMNFAKARFVTF